ncbi:NADH-quinone oxidoreductase subunit G [Campylobacter sp. JMF_01 NE2]|uniref:NADH-quinone oxidoreductase subunit G n=1 Tax=unclassified Campylobacter TaxID=2593542 RepID=UPI0022E9EB5B|nr:MULTISPECIES: NADH-quinone oxidoreductase subunit G [unclassified Campylobacter]MDA3052159.1 NADH-quinone oxidoreductase subunit G [Campylobacter sp. JMF_03 NE3]MDA3066493.1 NADH-quinone oxidoreductase subunit G [Campylobacter sp. JMF_01 NE2]
MAKITIDGQICEFSEGQSILEIARENGIYIPTLCYLHGASPTLACRLCMVEADEKVVYSCNAKAKEGMSVITNSPNLSKERNAIMQVYCINHPLECGVCDKSGECELQNLTQQMRVSTQSFAVVDSAKKVEDWGFLSYDPSLCIVCERCIKTAKDRLGFDAFKLVARQGEPLSPNLKDSMPKDAYAVLNKMQKSLIARVSDDDDCVNYGECAAACPTGALIVSAFKYSSNAWELRKIPASNPHTSDCELLFYEVKRKSISESGEKIYRVSSDINFAPLHAGARFGWDFSNENAVKNEAKFNEIVEKIKTGVIKNIKFNSFITNEEARILELLRERFDLNLINYEAKRYQDFLRNFSEYSGMKLYSGSEQAVRNSDFIVCAGSFLRSDAPNLAYALNNALKVRKSRALYFHAVRDSGLDAFGKNLISCQHKAGLEAQILLWILQNFGAQMPEWLDKKLGANFEISGENKVSNFAKNLNLDENALREICQNAQNPALIIGEDFIKHPRSNTIAKLLGMIERYTNFSVLIIPPRTNSLGVALICNLGEKGAGEILGYNEDGDFKFGVSEANLHAPSLVQQEGTFTNYDKRVVPTNAALAYGGYELNDIANALGVNASFAISYTPNLGEYFKKIKFDDLENFYDNCGENHRGYALQNRQISPNANKFDIFVSDEICAKNGEILIYEANPLHQFNAFTGISAALGESGAIFMHPQIAQELNLALNDIVKIECEGEKIVVKVKFDNEFCGIYLPYFDAKIPTQNIFVNSRYKAVKIEKIGGNNE